MIIGIDLGTTNSLVAFINNEGKPEIVINERGHRLTPSVVYFKDDSEVMVGEIARSQLVLKSDVTVSTIKRHMGSNYQVSIRGRTYTPTEISALILRKLVKYAEESLGDKVEAAVVTVPAYFNDNQRQATLMAGEIAGIRIAKLLNEPTAAALASGLKLDARQNVLVLDIGGGTFDITLMEYQEDSCRVIGSGGSTSLGGLDFDCRIVAHVLESFRLATGIDLNQDPIAMQQVHISVEKAKVDLSNINECSILVPYITMGAAGPLHLNQTLERDEFNSICQGLFEEISKLIGQTLAKANIENSWVDVIVLAGGASRMPGFRSLVSDMFPGMEIRSEINPDEIVALGAALEAGMLSGELVNIDLCDVTSHTLGIQDDAGSFVPLIPAGTPYPVEKSQLFTTVEDEQEEVIIDILQRDELDEAYISLGKFHLAGIRKGPAGEPTIDVSFDIDGNGILNVSALDIDTGIQNQVSITDLGYTGVNKILARRGKALTVI
ncbi:MAG: Hsp70 family protein [Syntrophomonadaceae bacterium]|nr:Hsp70 family protein [Syntrophomonadaceae bacterium]